MSRAKNRFLNKLREYFKVLPFDLHGKTVCVCLSGGADSVSLLFGMLDIANEYNFKIAACHFNHQIRGEAADNDEFFCKSLCKELSVKLYCGRDDVPMYAKTYKLSLEEAARECRYLFFNRILAKNNIDFCATAHTMNDDAETLLFNIIRGASTDGAASIATVNSKVLRPMLKIDRNEVEAYLAEESREYVTDATNLSNDYTRNYIRNVIFPKLSEINPSFISSFSKFIDTARCDREYFEEIVNEKLNCDLRNEHKAIRFRVYVKKCKDAFGFTPSRNVIEQIDLSLFSNIRTVINVTSLVDAIVDNGNVLFTEHHIDDVKEYKPIPLNVGMNEIFDDKITVIYCKENDLNNFNNLSTQCLMNSANIIGELQVRNRKVGDKITIHGINKSVKKLFIDRKIPKEYRDIIPIFFDSEGIVYIPFVGISDRVFTKSKDDGVLITTLFHTIDKERWVKAYEK